MNELYSIGCTLEVLIDPSLAKVIKDEFNFLLMLWFFEFEGLQEKVLILLV